MLRSPGKEFLPDAELRGHSHSRCSRLSFAGLPICLQDLAETHFYTQHLFFISPLPNQFPLCPVSPSFTQISCLKNLASSGSAPPPPFLWAPMKAPSLVSSPLHSPPSCQRDPLKHRSELKGLQGLPKWKLPWDLPPLGPRLVFQSILTRGASTVLRPQWTARGSLTWQLFCTSTKNISPSLMPIRTLHIKVV